MTKPTDTATPPQSPPPTKRRTRGPNKPKPIAKSIITVKTEAIVSQDGIRDLLVDHVTAQLGAEAAVGMELQICTVTQAENTWAALSQGDGAIRFATKGSK